VVLTLVPWGSEARGAREREMGDRNTGWIGRDGEMKQRQRGKKKQGEREREKEQYEQCVGRKTYEDR